MSWPTSAPAVEASAIQLKTLATIARFVTQPLSLVPRDARTTEQISEALADADAGTVKAVRDYERKFQGRQSVLDEAARVFPTSRASAREERAHNEKATFLRKAWRIASEPPT